MAQIKSETIDSEEPLISHVSHVSPLGYDSSYKKFEAVVNYLYDNVFVYFNEGTRKDILQIIWTTLPSNIYGKYSNRNDRWSRNCVLEAFQENEDCESDYMGQAISNLMNCTNIPHVSNAVTIFLKKRSHETESVSRTTELCSSCLSVTSAEAPRSLQVYFKSNPNKHKTDPRRQRRESINVRSGDMEKKMPILGTSPLRNFVVLFVVGLFLGTLCMLYKIHVQLNQIPKLDESVGVDTTTMEYMSYGYSEQHYSAIDVLEMSNSAVITAIIKNYIEYKNLIANLAFGQEINLTLFIGNPQDWPEDAIVNATDNIVYLNIVGVLNTVIILNILSSIPKLRSLTINNSQDHLCKLDRSANLYKDKVVSLPNLRFMQIEKLTECEFFYEHLLNLTDIYNLHTFRLSRSIVTENNLQHIQDFIKMSSNTIEFLEFPETEWNVSIFDYNIGTLYKLQYLHIDFMNRNFSTNQYIDIFFPNLISFTSSIGYISMSQFKNLSDCKNLQNLKVRILIPESQTNFQLSTIKAFFPYLKNATLYFKFESGETLHNCRIEGLEDIKTQIKKFQIRSNCPMVL